MANIYNNHPILNSAAVLETQNSQLARAYKVAITNLQIILGQFRQEFVHTTAIQGHLARAWGKLAFEKRSEKRNKWAEFELTTNSADFDLLNTRRAICDLVIL